MRQDRQKLWKQRSENKVCIYCGKNKPKEDKKGCEECLSKKVLATNKFSKNNKEKNSQYRLLIKHQVIEKYGGVCSCCGEDEILFLTIDHINNDGYINRIGTFSWYLKLKKEPLKEDLQVLCFNCNLGKEMNNGICPHKFIHRKLLPVFDNRHNSNFDMRTKIIWPSNEELINMCNETSVNQVSKKLGVNFSAVSNRLKRRGMYELIKKKTGGVLNGENNPSSKLTEIQVISIRNEIKNGISRKDISIKYNVSKTLIDKIVNYNIWKYI